MRQRKTLVLLAVTTMLSFGVWQIAGAAYSAAPVGTPQSIAVPTPVTVDDVPFFRIARAGDYALWVTRYVYGSNAQAAHAGVRFNAAEADGNFWLRGANNTTRSSLMVGMDAWYNSLNAPTLKPQVVHPSFSGTLNATTPTSSTFGIEHVSGTYPTAIAFTNNFGNLTRAQSRPSATFVTVSANTNPQTGAGIAAFPLSGLEVHAYFPDARTSTSRAVNTTDTTLGRVGYRVSANHIGTDSNRMSWWIRSRGNQPGFAGVVLYAGNMGGSWGDLRGNGQWALPGGRAVNETSYNGFGYGIRPALWVYDPPAQFTFYADLSLDATSSVTLNFGEYGTSYDIPDDIMTRPGYDLVGWSTDPHAETADFPESGPIDWFGAYEHPLYAVWLAHEIDEPEPEPKPEPESRPHAEPPRVGGETTPPPAGGSGPPPGGAATPRITDATPHVFEVPTVQLDDAQPRVMQPPLLGAPAPAEEIVEPDSVPTPAPRSWLSWFTGPVGASLLALGILLAGLLLAWWLGRARIVRIEYNDEETTIMRVRIAREGRELRCDIKPRKDLFSPQYRYALKPAIRHLWRRKDIRVMCDGATLYRGSIERKLELNVFCDG
ncbi:MAG: hypothetical protein FWG78_00400 [Coriobacteriia bacterium]|nr:hypothetical protein [Coriobacteriia bacterium]